MAKTDPFLLRRKRREVIRKEFFDPEMPHLKFPMTFRMPRSLDIVNIESAIADNNAIYIYGVGEYNDNGELIKNERYRPPVQIPPVGEEPVLLTEGSVRIITTVMYCQVSNTDGISDIYDFPQIAAMMAGSDYIAASIGNFYADICRHMEKLGESIKETENRSNSDSQDQSSTSMDLTQTLSEETTPPSDQ